MNSRIKHQMSLSFYHHLLKQYQLQHPSFQMHQRSIFFVLLLLPALASSSESPRDVPDSTQKTIKAIGDFVRADATVATALPTPAGLQNIIDIQIQEGNQLCSIVKKPPNAAKHTIISIREDGPQILKTKWNVEIMSTAIDQQTQTSYILLDNGTLIIGKSQGADLMSPAKWELYSFEGIGTVDTWLLEKYRLFWFNGELYCLAAASLLKLNIHQEGYWRPAIEPISPNVVSVLVSDDFLYFLTVNQLKALDKSGSLRVILEGEKLIDFGIEGGRYFLLDEKRGLSIGSLSQPSNATVYSIASISSVKMVRVYGSVLFLVYELEGRDYLAQYFISGAQLLLNRYYHNYYSVKDLHLTQHYAVLNVYNEFIIFRHSINRKSFNNLRPAEWIYQSHGVKVVDIKLLSSAQSFKFVVTFKETIELMMVNNSSPSTEGSFAMNNIFAECKSDKPQSLPTKMTYKGTCSASDLESESFYCTTVTSSIINFEFNHVKRLEEQKNTKFIILIVFMIIVIFVVLALIGAHQKISKLKRKLQAQKLDMKNKAEQHSSNMEQTFNADVQKQT